jgi:hypothetical protein
MFSNLPYGRPLRVLYMDQSPLVGNKYVHLKNYLIIMYSICSRSRTLLWRYYQFRGFDANGQPIIEERIKEGSSITEKILHLSSEDPMTTDTTQRIVNLLKDYDGVEFGHNFIVDLDWMLPYIENIVHFSGYKSKENNMKFFHPEKLAQFYKLKYLHCILYVPLDLSLMDDLEILSIFKTDFKDYVFGGLKKIMHITLTYPRNIHYFPLGASTPLKYLEIDWDRDTKSFEFIQDVHTLEGIVLTKVSQLHDWPDASKMTDLKFVLFDDVNKFSDFRGLSKAPNLEFLRLNISKLKPVQLEPLLDCKSLKYLSYYGTKKEMSMVQDMFKDIELNVQPSYFPGTDFIYE